MGDVILHEIYDVIKNSDKKVRFVNIDLILWKCRKEKNHSIDIFWLLYFMIWLLQLNSTRVYVQWKNQYGTQYV